MNGESKRKIPVNIPDAKKRDKRSNIDDKKRQNKKYVKTGVI
jgi:hypothetical protein